MKPQIILGVTLMISLTVSTGCKPNSSASSTKSLDNFVKEKGKTPNECSGTYSVFPQLAQVDISEISDPNKAVRATEAVKAALSAVPEDFQKQFASAGRIKVSPNADTLCGSKQQVASEDSKPSRVCWVQEGVRLIFLMPDDIAEISHSTVRMFGYFNFQILHAALNSDSPGPSAFKKNLGEMKMQVAAEFIKDLKGMQQNSRTKEILGKYQAGGADREHLVNQIMAETFDSEYCSRETRDAFRSFTYTYAYLHPEKTGLSLAGDDDPSLPQPILGPSRSSGDTNEIVKNIVFNNSSIIDRLSPPVFNSNFTQRWQDYVHKNKVPFIGEAAGMFPAAGLDGTIMVADMAARMYQAAEPSTLPSRFYRMYQGQ
jgi:hypothetical protein